MKTQQLKKGEVMFIRLTHDDGKKIWVNAAHLASYDANPDGVGTRIIFSNGISYIVKESFEEMRKKLHSFAPHCE